jgi:hypothetical protein
MSTPGGCAADNGNRAQRIVRELLGLKGYHRCPFVSTLGQLLEAKGTLYPVAGQFAEQCRVPLIARCYRPGRLTAVDFVVLSRCEQPILLSIKSQHSNGTAEQKLDCEMLQLIGTEQPAAMLVYGPLRGRDGDCGWSPDYLGEFWERARDYGASRLFLFRSVERLGRWIEAGLPTPSRGKTASEIFAEFCNREP